MNFEVVVFLPSLASFHTIFLKSRGTVESLRTITCHQTVARGNKGMLMQNIFVPIIHLHAVHKV